LHKQTERAGALQAIQRAANFSTAMGRKASNVVAKYLKREPVPESPGWMGIVSKIFGC